MSEKLTEAALRDALEPFATFASWAVDENGWTSATGRERICDWFGPSDFRRLAALLPRPHPQEDKP